MVKCFLQNAIKCTSQCEHKNTTFHFYRMAWNTLDDKWQFVLQLKNVILFIIWGTEKELRISENVFHTNHSTSQTWLLLWLHYCKHIDWPLFVAKILVRLYPNDLIVFIIICLFPVFLTFCMFPPLFNACNLWAFIPFILRKSYCHY